MRRSAIVFGLLAALAGAPLRQAEAASDLIRALAEGASLDPVDGGVGDDAGEGTLAADPGPLSGGLPSMLDADLPPPLPTPNLTALEAEGLRERAWWPTSPPGLRQVWLQVFRF